MCDQQLSPTLPDDKPDTTTRKIWSILFPIWSLADVKLGRVGSTFEN